MNFIKTNVTKMSVLRPTCNYIKNNYTLPILNQTFVKQKYTFFSKGNEEVKKNPKTIKPEQQTKEKKPNGLQINCEIKSPLKEFLKTDTASRVYVLKYAWKYIKDNNLQNPNKKRKIIPDEKLKLILEKDEVDMLEVPKLLFKHMSSMRKE
ncbi:SWIB/MDM2 domain-containing protein, putative [Hepatocystis sp. ex Piliocolobus tephrosceles]|nr:SWIB/MDM2 domain-containing protein, putative [Hepatocystis sp. ex Piliocolobus tephrosceles]